MDESSGYGRLFAPLPAPSQIDLMGCLTSNCKILTGPDRYTTPSGPVAYTVFRQFGMQHTGQENLAGLVWTEKQLLVHESQVAFDQGER